MSFEKYLVGPVVLLSGASLIAGCGGSGGSAGQASAKYDISKVSAVKGSLPAGYDPMDLERSTVTQEKLDAPGVGALTATPPSVVTPAECASMIKPLAPAGIGAQTMGFIGSNQEGHTIIVMAAEAKTIGELGHAGCDHFTVDSPDDINATVDRIPGPDVPGAKTMGVQAHITANGKTTEETTFTAIAGDKTVVVVQSDLDPQVAKDLLGKTVSALKS
ncbi:hypothetical protein FZI85_24010 [Mycobacterium sp. CBMA293]|uniref:DUF5642 family protein n=1 Tax=unclassified Mycolicibacterium TaxID=2636767 RepID=UPI0012DE4855|nr:MULTISPECIES: DUF5642 family protein [unclassified Mycolicibacterium]MUL45473.1 hypothetical protein [Mycolicibacterium sp. CBMA 360]MUL60143.1 hypothetical protein [Mycolicibacterium sp. CBMA 335]MUL72930.1 hypothetical protein [Mycolicibacterium sp. CBMA 311]MUL96095.1 hypothetical protein [Mycolicibacterium sp. CBMA 230]MUM08110.1 hypothetical protein [Mycolicibacterium sp. CBMA 213]